MSRKIKAHLKIDLITSFMILFFGISMVALLVVSIFWNNNSNAVDVIIVLFVTVPAFFFGYEQYFV